MFKKLTIIILCVLFTGLSVFAQPGTGTLKGKITDNETGEELPFVNIVVQLNGQQKGGASTDFDGKYTISSISPGAYDVLISFVGYQAQKIQGVEVKGDKIQFLNIKLKSGDVKLDEVEVTDYNIPLIDKDGGASGGTVTREDIDKMPNRSATSLATTVGGVYQDAGSQGSISVRGSRSDATYYYIDGIKVRGSTSLPKSAIEQVNVITGGVPANYGDATGGIISITTRGPSRKYFGGVELLTSGFQTGAFKSVGLDHYGYNLIEGTVSGPLWMKKDSTGAKTDPILGFFLSGNYTNQLDPRPFSVDQYKLKDDVKASIIASPLRPTGTGFGAYYNTDFVTPGDFEKVPFNINAQSQSANLSAKIDVNTGPNITLTFGGQFVYSNADIYNRANSMFNWDNNGTSRNITYRAYGRFTQRFTNATQDAGSDENSASTIKNAYYTVLVDYSKYNNLTQNQRHEDKLFNYGYVGKFDVYQEPSYEYDNGLHMFVHNGFADTLVIFTPSDINADAAAVTTQYFNLYDNVINNYENITQVQDGNAIINGFTPATVYGGLWNNIGTNYGTYARTDNNQFRVSSSGSADIGDHAITVGFEYEQRKDSYFGVAPIGLWDRGRLLMNSHIRELDLSSGQISNVGSEFYLTYNKLNASPGAYVGGGAQYFFDYNVRNMLGLNPDGTDWVNLYAVDPDQLRLDFFSADELLNDGSSYVAYYGYSYSGDKTKDKPTFDDFFTKRDAFGNFSRPVAAFEPIYVAGYIMDKFAFDDIIFNVGVRVDRFDANQMALKDPYLLFPAKTVAEVGSEFGTIPSNIPSDAIVYVNDLTNPTGYKGFRSGDTWYNASGIEVSEPSTIKTGAGIAPYLLDPSNNTVSSNAFEDYTPQINLMPRIAFSFPISDQALFFAHYDVLTKRPGTGNRLDPLDYFYLNNGNRGIINNPNLKPEKTISYELGFQQALSKSSSIKISLFYNEQRDQIQVVKILGSYPKDYDTYGNVDFGTVKGLTIGYDLRRSGNVALRASYTLQFAEGTGSDAFTGLNLVNSGQPNLRTIFPYNYDQRHALVVSLDYRYGDGKDYNGPVLFGKKIFANTGANIQARYGSGTPYSAQSNVTSLLGGNTLMEGTLNGSRKPSQFRIDVQIDRDVQLKWGKDEDKPKTANLNVYLLINNLLDNINVVNVYGATGNADDDGFLTASSFQNSISQQNSEEAYRFLYGMAANNPYNYGIPRTIRLGVKIDF